LPDLSSRSLGNERRQFIAGRIKAWRQIKKIAKPRGSVAETALTLLRAAVLAKSLGQVQPEPGRMVSAGNLTETGLAVASGAHAISDISYWPGARSARSNSARPERGMTTGSWGFRGVRR